MLLLSHVPKTLAENQEWFLKHYPENWQHSQATIPVGVDRSRGNVAFVTLSRCDRKVSRPKVQRDARRSSSSCPGWGKEHRALCDWRWIGDLNHPRSEQFRHAAANGWAWLAKTSQGRWVKIDGDVHSGITRPIVLRSLASTKPFPYMAERCKPGADTTALVCAVRWERL